MALHDKMSHALRVVAVLEACKGILVLFAGLALFSFIHQNIQLTAEQLVGHLHLNPAKNIPKIFIEASRHLTDARMLFLALAACLYSSMRFVEAYGLWFARRWAEWFALLSGSVYLPIELFELVKGVTWIKMVFISINLVIVCYMVVMLKRNGTRHGNNKRGFDAIDADMRAES